MAKLKSKWVCIECGYETPKHLGKCPECGCYGTLKEEIYSDLPKSQSLSKPYNYDDPSISSAQLLNEIKLSDEIRFSTGMNEFDRTLGGGLVSGELILIAGDPGIGKSTLLLQTSNSCALSNKKVLYVSAEESGNQIKLRAERLNVQNNKNNSYDNKNLYIYAQTNFELIKQQIEEVKPEILIIDSIQAVYSNSIPSSPGSVSQIRECTNDLMHIAKLRNITVIVVGHVTKDGMIAGPKVLEHMVDAVIYFEGDRYKSYRILRCIKNRFGTTSEVGIFSMEAKGLIEVENPSELFLEERQKNITSGNVIIATNEGTRPLLIELQALVSKTNFQNTRRVVNGIDYNRLLQIIAVLEKRIGLELCKSDIYINVIGGIEITEPAADLGIALAIASCFRDVIVNPNTVLVGEIGLSGELRAVNNIDKRIKEAEKLGFKNIIVPEQCRIEKMNYKKIKIIETKRLMDAICACINKS